MQSARQYLQQKMEPCIKQLFQHYLPDQEFKSIHDLLNAHKFHKLLMCILSEQTKIKISDTKLIEDSDQSYNEMRKKNFKKLFDIIEHSQDILSIAMKQKVTDNDINNLIESSDMKVLSIYMDHIFQLLKHNSNILEFITTLDQSIQNNIMEVMQNSQLSLYGEDEFQGSSDHSLSSLKVVSKMIRSEVQGHGNMIQLEEMQNHLQQMQALIQVKQEEIKELKFHKQQSDEQLQEIKKQLSVKNDEIQLLKKRILSYDEIDQLMVQKDEQILKLTKKLADRDLKSRLKQSQLTNENRHLHEKLSQLETKDLEVMLKYQKQKQIIQQLNKQKEESQTSMKKVINNLKDKNKSFMDKINDLQKELIEVNFEKQMKDKQLAQIKHSHHDQKKPSSSVFDNLGSPRSPLRDDFNQGLDSVRGNYSKLGEQLSIDLDRADFEDEFGPVSRQQNNKRFTQLLQQNYLLKQQLQKIQSSNFTDLKQSKQLQDEVQKMKKKINILKRRNDDIENQRKQQVDIMIGVMEQYYSSTVQQINKK